VKERPFLQGRVKESEEKTLLAPQARAQHSGAHTISIALAPYLRGSSSFAVYSFLDFAYVKDLWCGKTAE
jgi:hypothetical protein